MLINIVLKYAFIALAIAVSIKYILKVSTNEESLVKATLTLTLMVFLTECLLFNNMFEGLNKQGAGKFFTYDTLENVQEDSPISVVEEGVTPGPAQNAEPVDKLYLTPSAFSDPVKDDLINTGLNYDNNTPGYFLVNDGKYSEGTVLNDSIKDLIRESKFNDIVDQHNFNIVWSPHTHVGKNRGYLNQDGVYPTN